MYTAIFIVLFGIGIFLVVTGVRNKKKLMVGTGVAAGVFTILLYWFMDFWGEWLWFQSLGYGDRFWIVEFAQIGFGVLLFLIGAAAVFLLIFSVPDSHRALKIISILLAGIISGVWGFSNWEIILKFWNSVSTSLVDPIIGKDTGFYLFKLPFYESLQGLLVTLTLIALAASLIPILFIVRNDGNVTLRSVESYELMSASHYRAFYISAAAFLLALAYGKYLERFGLMFSRVGVTNGPGWTDVNLKLPALNGIYILTALFAVGILIPAVRKWIQRLLWRWKITNYPAPPFVVLALSLVMFVVWFVTLTAIPGLFQWLRVEPNEITFEKPFIEHNIRFTRHGFKLDAIEEKEFPVEDTLTPEMVKNNPMIFDNIRLWDYRALDNVYKQFQEIRLYYEFNDVDIDRYTVDGDYQQVMISAREMDQSNLPPQSQTFVNQRFKYTHGFGITLANVNEFTNQGLPDLLIKDIPPVSVSPELEVTEPRIYYGELTNTHVVVNSDEEEFDYPSGDQNVYNRYDGTGGVQLSNLWRKFLYGYKFDGTKFFVSGYPNKESRIMFHRNIMDRVRTLAPFLEFDSDPYIVLSEGKLYWMIDAYTLSDYFPYSEYYGRINYLRNAVKIVVDAYNGSVDFYVFDEEDPIIKVWSKIFTGMFKSREEMPVTLEQHIRYPAEMLEIQGMVYAKYHMNNPTVFYNQEDLWVRATEKYYGEGIAVEPYYIIWEMPDSDEPEYVLMMPFTPKNRQVMIGWIAGMCDPPNYGRLLAYQFPKDKRVLGPQQVETKIDQDRYLSAQLSLWDQRGSNVIRGNVLAIPVGNTMFYVEPIYLQARTAAYPELRLVIVMHNDNLTYAPTFDEALNKLFEEAGLAEAEPEDLVSEVSPVEVSTRSDLIIQANQAFERYIRSTGDKDFDAAGDALNDLQKALQQLAREEAIPVDTIMGQ